MEHDVFTKKHYEAVAKELRVLQGSQDHRVTRSRYITGYDDAVVAVTDRLATLFAEDNPNFDRVKFLAAAGLK